MFKLIKHYFLRQREDVSPTERLAFQKTKSFERRHSLIINALLITEVVIFFSVIFME